MQGVEGFDAILQLGYTSSSVWGFLLPKSAVIITNMDGLEWKRSKYPKPVKIFLKFAEKWAVSASDYLISDSIGIQDYLAKEYNKTSEFIAYGAEEIKIPVDKILQEYNQKPYSYDMLVARLEPENNIETVLEGIKIAQIKRPMLVIGKHETKYGRYLKNKFSDQTNILFLGGIYDKNNLDSLRYYSNLYFHGHSVGGTNPSLLEAMASSALIVAHNNVFNKSVLEENAFFFRNSRDIANLLNYKKENFADLIKCNLLKINKAYSWNLINTKYEAYIEKCISDFKK